MPVVVPLQPVSSQIVAVSLANQACKIAIKQRSTGLFADLYVNDALVIGGVLALDRNVIVRSAWLGFIGDLAFFDIQSPPFGPLDPFASGIGSRFFLGWFAPSELPPGLA